MFFNNIETHNTFASVPFQFNLVHLIKRTELFSWFLFIYTNKYLVCNHHWNKIIFHPPHICFSHWIEWLTFIILNFIWLYEIANMSFHKILSYIATIIYYLTNQFSKVDIDNYHVLFLSSAIYIHKRRYHSLCYSFIYNKRHQSINIFVYESWLSHILNVEQMNSYSTKILVFCIWQVI